MSCPGPWSLFVFSLLPEFTSCSDACLNLLVFLRAHANIEVSVSAVAARGRGRGGIGRGNIFQKRR